MVDLIIIIMMLLFIIVGYKKGLIKELITFSSSLIALVLAFIVYPVINALLKLTALYTIIYTGVLGRIEKIEFGKGLQTQGKAIVEQITWLPKVLTEQIKDNNNTAMYELLGVHTLEEYISTYITQMIISLIAILVTWFLIKVILVLVLKMVGSIVEHLPIISGFNHLGGGIIGTIKGVLTLSILALLVPVMLTIPSLSELGMNLETSYLLDFIYKHNLVIELYHYFLM
ncbi:MAG: hypothetical protein E7231_07425 [Cellulosilyticum sp.]|nr:hypothetical protein [Cellulosilyticum sp.]